MADQDTKPPSTKPLNPLRERIHEIIFEADTRAGYVFDLTLLLIIIASVIVICLQTVAGFRDDPEWMQILQTLQWGFTITFTVEFLFRVFCVRKPLNYIFSFWGIIDLLAFLPEYIFLFPGARHTSAFSVARSLRLLRVFRIFNLGWVDEEALDLGNAIWRARAKVLVFLTTVMIIVTVCGTIMYELELNAENSKFDSIPSGIYWAIVTMTTVGFGDIVPVTPAGKFLSAFLILVGYSLIIVPTGFVSAEIVESRMKASTTRSCPSCLTEGHDRDAKYCKYCGETV